MTSKGWLPIVAGVGVGIVGLLLWQKHAAAAVAAPALPSVAPASASVALQPGATTVSVAKGGSVILTLPAGASWSTSSALPPITPLASTGVQPTGNTAMSITMGQTYGIITANWVDSTNTAQVTTINVAVS